MTATKKATKSTKAARGEAATLQWVDVLRDVQALSARVAQFASDTLRFDRAIAEAECALADLCPARA